MDLGYLANQISPVRRLITIVDIVVITIIILPKAKLIN